MAHPRNGTCLFLMVAMFTVLWAGAEAQSSDCTNVIISLLPCLNYINGNSSTPTTGCCTQLASVVKSQPQCLCEALNGGGSSLGLNINRTQAAALPVACKVQTPPLSQCNAASPGNSPSSGTPGSSGTSSGSGSNRGASTDNSSPSDAGSIKLAVPLLFFLLFASSALTSPVF